MNDHLSDREFAQWLAGDGDVRVPGHVADCEQCRNEGERMLAAIAEFRGQADSAGAHDDFFWSRQRHAILAAAQDRGVHRLRWAVSLVMAVAAVSMALLVAPAQGPKPVPMSDDRADEQLLLAVQSDLAQDAPDALQPAEVLQEERATLLAQMETQKQERRNIR